MDIWLYYHVTHLLHRYCNPVSEETVREMEGFLDLGPDTRVLDIASGLGEMLVGFAERHGAGGTGIEISKYFFERAERRKARRAPEADLEFILMDGKDFRLSGREPYDVVMNVGASWIWDGFRGTLRALREFVKPGGLIVSAEPYWKQPPDPAYLEADGMTADQFTTLEGTWEIAKEEGLSLVWMRGSSDQDWDRYETVQAASFDHFARQNPDHPDLAEIAERHHGSLDVYFRWGRQTIGFAFWVFRVAS
jgi:SAM-dependent methyltransferase